MEGADLANCLEEVTTESQLVGTIEKLMCFHSVYVV